MDVLDVIRPAAEELRWLEVGWRSDLEAARQEAERRGRPLFIWAMNGDPLGCV